MLTAMEDSVWDAIVIGGGPAGSTAAATLARAGHSLVLCEQAVFPRFHIGESLLPAGNEILAAIGVWEKVERAGFIRKLGAEFDTADGSERVHNVFAEGLQTAGDHTYQVERSRFDHLLLEHAWESGAHLLQPVKVIEVRSEPNGWAVRTDDNRVLRARFLVDASGRKALLARQQKIKRMPLPYVPKVAIYGHFHGVWRAGGDRGGNIIITRWRNGWFWHIPIGTEKTSVGLVTPVSVLKGAGNDPERLFKSVVAASPVVADRMRNASLESGYHVTADYTYAYQHFAGERFFLAGDAACFIDPIFSSGVCLALKSGYAAALNVSDVLRRGADEISPRLQRRYTRRFQRDVRVMRGLIDAFYDRRGIEVFLRPTSKWRLFETVNTIVGGRTRLSWPLWWRYAVFRTILGLHRRQPFVAPITEEALGSELKRPANIPDLAP